MTDSMVRVAIPGGWAEQPFEIAGRTLRLLVPADPDEFVSQLEGEDEARLPRMRADPYWAKIWQAAPLFVRAVSRSAWPASAKILELGCGIGLPGLAACLQGHHVTFTDYVAEAVQLVLENARRNDLAALAAGQTLDWFDPPRAAFDVVLASDVTYEPRLHEPLLRTIESVLAPAGEAWIADPGRGRAREFALAAERMGFGVEVFDEDSRPTRDFVIGQFRRTVLRRGCRPSAIWR